VEGHHPHTPRDATDQGSDPIAHLVGRLVREGDRQDLIRVCPPGRQQPGDPVRQGTGLARSRPGEDQQRPLVEGDRLALRAVQAREQALDLVGARLDWPPAGLALYLLFDVRDGPRIVRAPARSGPSSQLNRLERRSRTGR
jgi:hypothetical protein